MIASQPVDQDIEQAIQRLQRKMQDVSDSLDKAAPKRSADPKNKTETISQKMGLKAC